MIDHNLINIILSGNTPRLHQVMAHYEDLCSDQFKWKKKLLHMDFIRTEFEKKEQNNRSKGQRKKYGLEELVQLREADRGSEKKCQGSGERPLQQQRLTYVGLCTEEEALEWWKANRHWDTTWEEVKNAIRESNRNQYKPDRGFHEISDVKYTSTVQTYVNDIDRLNIYAKMTNHH